MIGKVVTFIVSSVVITFGIAGVLILSQRPKEIPPGDGLDFSQTLENERQVPKPLTQVAMRDGFPLQVRRYDSIAPDAPLLVLVHGSGWHGLHFDGLARSLTAVADVIAPDLRGHGPKPGQRGDIEYINQLEDDLADLIKATAKPGQKVVLGGHSSGGGLVLRFAGGAHGGMLDGALLLAPFLKYNAPTTRQNSGGWTNVLTRRIIGLSMLNSFGITALNHLTVIQLRMPQAVLDGPLGDTATTTYSYRLNTGFAPHGDYLRDVAALPRFTLIVGAQDEAFDAALYEPTMGAVTDKGTYVIVDGVKHLDIVDAVQTRETIESYLNDF
ncbi:alpha/beta fold hydrolase [Sulfitobacter sp. F26204]|uniref:alpha/beta hydrolase n=1 Tax=Sulfitobacter sp. F26204 TaxID=2996014 RepID=UPI00225E655F|nr:alpha/beta fold hydrolase [Sulfitobacter sp. F26204]MCX7559525.1 alpha/beta fold hydrolase [Sulfitobacter sp. F26204]